MKTIHCPHCSKEVPVLKNGLVKPHISSRKIQCIWGGQKASSTQRINDASIKRARSRS